MVGSIPRPAPACAHLLRPSLFLFPCVPACLCACVPSQQIQIPARDRQPHPRPLQPGRLDRPQHRLRQRPWAERIGEPQLPSRTDQPLQMVVEPRHLAAAIGIDPPQHCLEESDAVLEAGIERRHPCLVLGESLPLRKTVAIGAA